MHSHGIGLLRFVAQEVTCLGIVVNSRLLRKDRKAGLLTEAPLSILHSVEQPAPYYAGWRRVIFLVSVVGAILWFGLTIAYGV